MAKDDRPSLFEVLTDPEVDPADPLYGRPWARATDDAVARLARAMILAAGIGVFVSFSLRAFGDANWVFALLSVAGALFFGTWMLVQVFLAQSALLHALHLFYAAGKSHRYSRRLRLLAFTFTTLSCFVVALGVVSAVSQLQSADDALEGNMAVRDAEDT